MIQKHTPPNNAGLVKLRQLYEALLWYKSLAAKEKKKKTRFSHKNFCVLEESHKACATVQGRIGEIGVGERKQLVKKSSVWTWKCVKKDKAGDLDKKHKTF